MFIGAFERLRAKLIQQSTGISYIAPRAGAFDDFAGEVVQSVLFTFRKDRSEDYLTCYMDLSDASDKQTVFCQKM